MTTSNYPDAEYPDAEYPDAEFENLLTAAQLERLAVLSEELGEVQQVIGKILRHGYSSWNPDSAQVEDNRMALERELGDVLFVIDFLCKSGDVSRQRLDTRVAEKSNAIWAWLHHNFRP